MQNQFQQSNQQCYQPFQITYCDQNNMPIQQYIPTSKLNQYLKSLVWQNNQSISILNNQEKYRLSQIITKIYQVTQNNDLNLGLNAIEGIWGLISSVFNNKSGIQLYSCVANEIIGIERCLQLKSQILQNEPFINSLMCLNQRQKDMDTIKVLLKVLGSNWQYFYSKLVLWQQKNQIINESNDQYFQLPFKAIIPPTQKLQYLMSEPDTFYYDLLDTFDENQYHQVHQKYYSFSIDRKSNTQKHPKIKQVINRFLPIHISSEQESQTISLIRLRKRKINNIIPKKATTKKKRRPQTRKQKLEVRQTNIKRTKIIKQQYCQLINYKKTQKQLRQQYSIKQKYLRDSQKEQKSLNSLDRQNRKKRRQKQRQSQQIIKIKKIKLNHQFLTKNKTVAIQKTKEKVNRKKKMEKIEKKQKTINRKHKPLQQYKINRQVQLLSISSQSIQQNEELLNNFVLHYQRITQINKPYIQFPQSKDQIYIRMNWQSIKKTDELWLKQTKINLKQKQFRKQIINLNNLFNQKMTDLIFKELKSKIHCYIHICQEKNSNNIKQYYLFPMFQNLINQILCQIIAQMINLLLVSSQNSNYQDLNIECVRFKELIEISQNCFNCTIKVIQDLVYQCLINILNQFHNKNWKKNIKSYISFSPNSQKLKNRLSFNLQSDVLNLLMIQSLIILELGFFQTFSKMEKKLENSAHDNFWRMISTKIREYFQLQNHLVTQMLQMSISIKQICKTPINKQKESFKLIMELTKQLFYQGNYTYCWKIIKKYLDDSMNEQSKTKSSPIQILNHIIRQTFLKNLFEESNQKIINSIAFILKKLLIYKINGKQPFAMMQTMINQIIIFCQKKIPNSKDYNYSLQTLQNLNSLIISVYWKIMEKQLKQNMLYIRQLKKNKNNDEIKIQKNLKSISKIINSYHCKILQKTLFFEGQLSTEQSDYKLLLKCQKNQAMISSFYKQLTKNQLPNKIVDHYFYCLALFEEISENQNQSNIFNKICNQIILDHYYKITQLPKNIIIQRQQVIKNRLDQLKCNKNQQYNDEECDLIMQLQQIKKAQRKQLNDVLYKNYIKIISETKFQNKNILCNLHQQLDQRYIQYNGIKDGIRSLKNRLIIHDELKHIKTQQYNKQKFKFYLSYIKGILFVYRRLFHQPLKLSQIVKKSLSKLITYSLSNNYKKQRIISQKEFNDRQKAIQICQILDCKPIQQNSQQQQEQIIRIQLY